MAGHIIANFCKTPTTLLRRVGAVWICDCGQIWTIRKAGPYGTTKTWTRVKSDV